MKCKVLNVVKVNRDETGQLPYYVIKARGTEGDADADAVVDGMINFAAVQSRVFNFTKCLFPATERQCENLDASFAANEDGEVTKDIYVCLTYYRWETGRKFLIYDSNGEVITETKEVEKTAVKDGIIDGKMLRKGQKYKTLEEVPRIFTNISLTLFCDEEGNIKEGDGNPETLAKRNFEAGLASGRYELVQEDLPPF